LGDGLVKDPLRTAPISGARTCRRPSAEHAPCVGLCSARRRGAPQRITADVGSTWQKIWGDWEGHSAGVRRRRTHPARWSSWRCL